MGTALIKHRSKFEKLTFWASAFQSVTRVPYSATENYKRNKLYLLDMNTRDFHMYTFTWNLCLSWILSLSSLFSLIRSRCFLFSNREYNSARYSITEKDWTVLGGNWSAKYGLTVKTAKDIPG